MSTAAFPPLIDDLGQPSDPRTSDYIEAHQIGGTAPYANAALAPLGWNQGKPDGSRMVGWTLHYAGKSSIVAQHAFAINPQSLTRTDSSRNQMFATQGGFYVDDFGPGSISIQLTQLVASGRASAGGGGSLARATAREDVLRFYDVIYTAVTATPGKYDCYFHDNHLWNIVDSKTPEKVYFPPQAFQLVRAVSLHNVWQIQLTMGTLVAPPAATQDTGQIPGQPKIRVYVVHRGDTLIKIASTMSAGPASAGAQSHQRILQIEQQIIALTKKYGKDDITKARTVTLYSAANPAVAVGETKVARLHLGVGEKIILPAG